MLMSLQGNVTSETYKDIRSALRVIDEDEWIEMCKACFPHANHHNWHVNDIIDLIMRTDTCEFGEDCLTIWIDEDGDYKINVP